MKDAEPRRFTRRQILAGSGLTILTGLAGCTGGGGENEAATTTSTTAETTATTQSETSATTATTTTEDTDETTTTTTTETPTTSEDVKAIPPGTRLEFDGFTSAWRGLNPDSIEGADNPTLVLESGAEYTFWWENGDNAPHNVIFEDSSGDTQFVRTEIISSGTQEVTFTAEEGMSTYYCEVHPTSMRGDVEVV